MPTPKEGESKKDYVKRCIPIVLDEGTAKDPSQANAICHSMYDQAQKMEEEGVLITSDELLKVTKIAIAKVKKEGYYGEPTVGVRHPDPHLNPEDPSEFIGGYPGCIEHLVQCEGYDPQTAKDMCGYLLLDRGGYSSGQPAVGKTEEEQMAADAIKAANKGWGDFTDGNGDELNGDEFGDDFDLCVERMVEMGHDEDEATRICEGIMESKRGKGDRELVTTHPGKMKGVVVGDYPEIGKGKVPKSPKEAETEALDRIEVPESLRPKTFFGEKKPVDLPQAEKKKESPLPKHLSPRKYGEMDDEIEVKQP